MKVLYIGEPQTHEKYLKGIVPSHWLYGACEMERDGHDVIWEQESGELFHDIRLLKTHKPDIVFIPNLNIGHHKLLLAKKALGLCNTPVYAYLHHGRPSRTGIGAKIIRFLLSGVNHLFFLSQKSMAETTAGGYVDADKCSCPDWGPDMDFYGKVPVCDNGRFVSTGKENRDFDILIEAFKQTGAPLTIMTARAHGDNDYSDLKKRCKDISNIEVVITENTGDVYPKMLKAMADARALVCPLMTDRLSYCVGLSTIADAEGLGKQLIITKNPYHDRHRIKDFNQVVSVQDWVDAINGINKKFKNGNSTGISMQSAYEQMSKVLFG